MSEHTLDRQLEQIETNLALAAQELGVAYKTANDPSREAEKVAFFTSKSVETEKSDAQKQAERVERLAEDSITIAEAAGVSSYKVDGEATDATTSSAAKNLFGVSE